MSIQFHTDLDLKESCRRAGIFNYTLASHEWIYIPSIFRLSLTGTGTITLESKDFLGVVTTGIYSLTVSNVINEIAYPYAGDKAIAIKAIFPTSLIVKIL
jgi:hypothetical protein